MDPGAFLFEKTPEGGAGRPNASGLRHRGLLRRAGALRTGAAGRLGDLLLLFAGLLRRDLLGGLRRDGLLGLALLRGGFLRLAGDGAAAHREGGDAGQFFGFFDRHLFVGGTPKDEELADHLDAGAAQRLGDFRVDRLTLFAVVGGHAHLDEFVGLQFTVDFLHHGFREAVRPEKDDGIEVMGLRTKRKARVAPEDDFFHNSKTSRPDPVRSPRETQFNRGDSMPVATKKLRSNRAWIERHINDPFVKRSRAEGYRARSVYKLTELDDREHLLRRGMTVVDLGAAPGSWTQIVRERLSDKEGRVQGRIIAMDILPMDPIEGVTFLQGDFREQDVADKLSEILNGDKVDVVLSDMAPNLSGIAAADAARSLLLNELAHEFCLEHLKPTGVFVTKAFQGSGYSQFVEALKKSFKKVYTRKPAASRDTSAEVYLVARELKAPK